MKSITEYDQRFKIVVVGNFAVGKTAIVTRLVQQKYSQDNMSTLGVDVRFKSLQVDGKKIRLQIWDTAGQEVFRTIISAYYRGADAIVIVHDLTEPQTFEDIQTFWWKQIEENKPLYCQMMVLGSKKDDQDSAKSLNEEQTQNIKRLLSTDLYFQTSAKTDSSIQTAFYELTRRLVTEKRRRSTFSPCISIKQQKNKGNIMARKCCKN